MLHLLHTEWAALYGPLFRIFVGRDVIIVISGLLPYLGVLI